MAALAIPPAAVMGQTEGTFSSAGEMLKPRASHTATRLPDGRVLIVGGGLTSGRAAAEIWDPAEGGSEASGSLSHGRLQHAATLLPGGEVLVTGGLSELEGPGSPIGAAELWDSSTGTFSASGTSDVVGVHSATLLPDGSVLLIGNDATDRTVAQVWGSVERGFGPPTPLAQGRFGHSASLLSDGRVLVVGGGWSPTLGTAEIWYTGTSASSPAGSMSGPRVLHEAVALPDDRVLVVGGLDDCCTTPAVELWDPSKEAFETAGPLAEARSEHTATLMADGAVLVVGGSGAESPELATAESTGNRSPRRSPPRARSRWAAAATPPRSSPMDGSWSWAG